jgi:hypothetical protein
MSIAHSMARASNASRPLRGARDRVHAKQVTLTERLDFVLHAVPRIKPQAQHLLLELITPECEQAARYCAHKLRHLRSARER